MSLTRDQYRFERPMRLVECRKYRTKTYNNYSQDIGNRPNAEPRLQFFIELEYVYDALQTADSVNCRLPSPKRQRLDHQLQLLHVIALILTGSVDEGVDHDDLVAVDDGVVDEGAAEKVLGHLPDAA